MPLNRGREGIRCEKGGQCDFKERNLSMNLSIGHSLTHVFLRLLYIGQNKGYRTFCVL